MASIVLAVEIDNFFTWDSLKTFQGALLATFVVGVGAKLLVTSVRLAAWVAFLFAMALELFLAWQAEGTNDKWFVAVANGFLIFSSALGVNEFLAARFKPPPPSPPAQPPGEGSDVRAEEREVERRRASREPSLGARLFSSWLRSE